ncbi:MAG: hypothetical protein WC043_03385 [Pseudobdellovibrionaceae bacterium]
MELLVKLFIGFFFLLIGSLFAQCLLQTLLFCLFLTAIIASPKILSAVFKTVTVNKPHTLKAKTTDYVFPRHILIIALLSLCFSLYNGYSVYQFETYGVKANAQVVKYEYGLQLPSKHTGPRKNIVRLWVYMPPVKFEFTDKNGIFSTHATLGTTVPVLVLDPKKAKAIVDHGIWNWASSFLWGVLFFTAFISWLAIFLVLSRAQQGLPVPRQDAP